MQFHRTQHARFASPFVGVDADGCVIGADASSRTDCLGGADEVIEW
jgi:hypothetical protein